MYKSENNWHTTTFIAKAFWAYDYNGAGHTWGMNELFEFNSGVYVSEVSVGVMEKYAILIGGGDTDASKNFDAFWIDTKEMYNVLVNQYGYHPENVYLQFWDHQKGYKDGIYIDGPADWEVDVNNLAKYGLGITQTLEVLRAKMTEDDFFYLFATSHGGMTSEKGGDGTGTFQIYNVESGGSNDFHYANPRVDRNLDREIDKMSYARCVIVISACGSGTAIHGTNAHPEWNLKGDRRIIITSTDKNEYGWNWGGDWKTDADNDMHAEFLWNEENNGFIYALDNSGKISLKTAFDSGYEAAQDDELATGGADISTPQLYEWRQGVSVFSYL